MKRLILFFILLLTFFISKAQVTTTQYTFKTMSDMKNYMAGVTMHGAGFVIGKNATNDGKGGFYWFDPTISGSGNTWDTIRPMFYINNSANGGWIRFTNLRNITVDSTYIDSLKIKLANIRFPGPSSKYIGADGSLIMPPSGEANTASNVGSGLGWYKQKSGVDLQLKSLIGLGITIASNTNDLTISLPTKTSSTVSHSLVTTTSSTGFQISSTLDYNANYSIYAQVTSALAGTNTGDVYLEIAATNSTTPSDWTTISRSGISMAGLVSTSGNTQTVSGFIPKGYYARIRTIATGSNSGSSVFTYQVGQENSY